MRIIRLQPMKAAEDDPRRLNPFPGRALGEREFELLQAYADDRIAPLVATREPGIRAGLEVVAEGAGAALVLHIRPGEAVAGGGRLVRLFYPMAISWPDLRDQAERDLDAKLKDGLFLLTLRSAVEAVDEGQDGEACTRTEPDPLRQRRLETVCLPGLAFVTANPRLLGMPQTRAANRICRRFLDQSPHDPDTGAVPLALIKVTGGLPEWLDPVAGRYLARPDSAQATLFAQAVAVMEEWLAEAGPPKMALNLADTLGLDYLPGAGPFPPPLVERLADKLPGLRFREEGLQVELAPVPASTVGAVIEREMPRGPVDLVHGGWERLRLLLAIPDADYRPNLLDFPQRDLKLEDELFVRGQAATDAWAAWRGQWDLLHATLNADELKTFQAPALVAQGPDLAGPYRDNLVTARGKLLAKNELLPEPYASHAKAPHPGKHEATPVPAPAETPLFRQHENLRAEIDALEEALDEGYRLLNEVADFLGLQRQQLDSLTVSFSTLAGGVTGDGRGLNLVRFTNKALFKPTP